MALFLSVNWGNTWHIAHSLAVGHPNAEAQPGAFGRADTKAQRFAFARTYAAADWTPYVSTLEPSYPSNGATYLQTFAPSHGETNWTAF